jgi:hypothetical protein
MVDSRTCLQSHWPRRQYSRGAFLRRLHFAFRYRRNPPLIVFDEFVALYQIEEISWRRDSLTRISGYPCDLALEAAIAKLDKYHLLILDDLAYVAKDRAETSVLFELIGARYERRSLLITANQPFGEWGKIFPDPAMTLAAIDRTRPSRDDPRNERRQLST